MSEVELDTPEWFLKRWLGPLLRFNKYINRDELVEAKYVNVEHAVVVKPFTIEGLALNAGGVPTYAPHEDMARRGDMVTYRKDEREDGGEIEIDLPGGSKCYKLTAEQWKKFKDKSVDLDSLKLKTGRSKVNIKGNVKVLMALGIPQDISYFIAYRLSRGYWPKWLQEKYEKYSGARYRDNWS